MRIAVVFVGALGSLFAGYLAPAGEDVSAIEINPEIVSAIRQPSARKIVASAER